MKTILILSLLVNLCFAVAFIKLYYEQKKLKLKKWRRMAITDSLTGVYNRNAYIYDIANIDIKKGKYGIILFDIDGFKKINDEKGHLFGDNLLKEVAGTLSLVFSSKEYKIYRIGGDEFAVITKNRTEQQNIIKMIEVKEYLNQKGDIRLSSGYSMIKGNVKKAFKYADEMLYADKESRKKKQYKKIDRF